MLLTSGWIAAFLLFRTTAQEQTRPTGPYQYLTICWAGKDNSHLIRPGGQVEFIRTELRKLVRPDRVNERSFYMNAAMNASTKDGYEFAGSHGTPENIDKRSGASAWS